MRIVVTGGSSFVGAWFCHLAAVDHDVLAVYNRTPVSIPGTTSVHCDLGTPGAGAKLRELGADAVVHLACKVKGTGNGRQETDSTRLNKRMMDAVLEAGLPTVYASSTCVHWPGESGYKRGRVADELRLRDSGLPFAIVRPCAPYGPYLPRHRPSHKESFHTLAEMVRKSPLVPVIGNGQYTRQPVHVDDFNGSILRLLEKGLPGAAFDSGGEDVLTMDEIVRVIAKAAGKRRRPLHVPKRAILFVSRFSKDFEPDLLDTADTPDTADPRPLAEATGLWPRSFRAGVDCLLS
ncbi:MAG: NAD(P)-dependent oxidoreductase [Proteobacteria bacterium]|nr:NAD(P)-dependent oxidoreductase [Pseudomonadota bacterium]MCP4916450.1 NAD(P)-dependent oxidoreductase [Pseudomonadota bacterium]